MVRGPTVRPRSRGQHGTLLRIWPRFNRWSMATRHSRSPRRSQCPCATRTRLAPPPALSGPQNAELSSATARHARLPWRLPTRRASPEARFATAPIRCWLASVSADDIPTARSRGYPETLVWPLSCALRPTISRLPQRTHRALGHRSSTQRIRSPERLVLASSQDTKS